MISVQDISTKLILLKKGRKKALRIAVCSLVLQEKMCTKLINSYTVYKKTLNITKCMRYQFIFTFLKRGKKALWIRALRKKFY